MNIDRAMAIAKEYGCSEDQGELEWLARQASKYKLIVEIGSWVGRTTRAMADNTTGVVFSVDTWEGTTSEPETMAILESKPKGWLWDSFQKNTQDLNNVCPIRMTSIDAASYLSKAIHKFNMIFIDADHTYDCVKEDILAWHPLLAEGGLFCGHDYNLESVRRAVSELLPNHRNECGVIWVA